MGKRKKMRKKRYSLSLTCSKKTPERGRVNEITSTSCPKMRKREKGVVPNPIEYAPEDESD